MGTAAVALGREGDNIKYMNYLELEKEAYQEYMDEIREEEIALYRSWKNGEISTDEYMEMLSALSLKEYLDERHHCVLTTDEVDANLSDIKKEIEEVLRLLKYEVGPSKEKDANKIDHKIANKIGDLKIVLAKDKDNCEEKALEILNLIKIDVAERKVYSK